MKRLANSRPILGSLAAILVLGAVLVACQGGTSPTAPEATVPQTQAAGSATLGLKSPGPIGGRPLSADLTGAAEVPGPGDPDGSGSAAVTLNQGQGEVCFDIAVADVDPIVAAHIHVGTADVAGPVVVNFDVATNGLSGCVDEVDADLIKAIRQDPQGYYVNVHNPAFPPGALRGQLTK